MKIINKQNFFPTVSVVFTILVLSKVLLEAITQNVFGGYQKNLVTMFLLSLLATFVLSQHYRFQRFPLLVVMLLQYLLLIGTVMLFTWMSSFFEPLHQDGYRDMFLSFSVPYLAGAVIYYISLFIEIKRVDRTIKDIRRYQNEE